MKVNHFVLLLALIINLSTILHAQLPQDNLRYSSFNSSGDLENLNWSFLPLIDEISDLTCIDTNSRADQCFNYFTFSIFWPRGLGYQYLTQKKPIKQELVNKNYWGIHGIWPTVINGNVPEKCKDQTRRSLFNVEHIKKANLYQSLELNWFNIIYIRNRDNRIENFWRKEYDKHGCCAARAQSITDDVGYFKSALDMLNNINPDTNVKKSGLDIGQTAVLGTFYDRLTENLKSKVQLKYVSSSQSNEVYLTEIRVCYDLSLTKIDCPGYSGPKNSERSSTLRLLSSMPRN